MRILLRHGFKVDCACRTWKNGYKFILVLLDQFLLECFVELKLLQSLFLCLLLLKVLLLKLLVLGCVAMFRVNFLALKTFTADCTLELISVKEPLWLRVRPWYHKLILDLLRDFFLRFHRLLLYALFQHVLRILDIGLQLLTLENMFLSQSFLLWLMLNIFDI